jgi:hypothetical protein
MEWRHRRCSDLLLGVRFDRAARPGLRDLNSLPLVRACSSIEIKSNMLCDVCNCSGLHEPANLCISNSLSAQAGVLMLSAVDAWNAAVDDAWLYAL